MSGGMVFSWEQFNEAAERYVESGLAGTKDRTFMAERQRDVDGARAFLMDAACAKLRKGDEPAPPILQPREGFVHRGRP